MHLSEHLFGPNLVLIDSVLLCVHKIANLVSANLVSASWLSASLHMLSAPAVMATALKAAQCQVSQVCAHAEPCYMLDGI